MLLMGKNPLKGRGLSGPGETCWNIVAGEEADRSRACAGAGHLSSNISNGGEVSS
jgi:hypothetical protein